MSDATDLALRLRKKAERIEAQEEMRGHQSGDAGLLREAIDALTRIRAEGQREGLEAVASLDAINIYRIIKRSKARRHADIAKVIAAAITPTESN